MVGKESYNRMALKCCTNTEIRWCRKLTSLDCLLLREILLPISFNRLLKELRIENTEGFNCNWLKKITAVEVCTFLLVAWSSHLCCCTCLTSSSVDVGLGQRADHGNVRTQRLAALPRDDTVRSLPICPGFLWRAFQLRQRNELPSRWGHGALLTGPGISCKENYYYYFYALVFNSQGLRHWKKQAIL